MVLFLNEKITMYIVLIAPKMKTKLNGFSPIVVTYSQFDSNIRVFYVFLGFLKNTLKYFIQRPIFKPLYFYNDFLKILENTSFWAPSKNTRISYVTTMTVTFNCQVGAKAKQDDTICSFNSLSFFT